MYARVPKKEPSYIHMGKNIRSLSMEPHVDGRPTYNGVRPGSPWGSLMTLFLPQCHAAFSMIPSTLAWVDQSPISQHVSGNPHQVILSTTVTASLVTQGRAEYKSTIHRGTDKGWICGRPCSYLLINVCENHYAGVIPWLR